LELNNSRDIKRKKFCSHSCVYKYLNKKYGLIPPRQTPEVSERAGKIRSLRMKLGLIPKPPEPTKETRKKAGLKMRGKNHWKWIKDRTKLKKSRFNCSERFAISTWRKDVMERDNYTCQATNKIGGKLEVHHIFNYSDYPKKRYEIENGVTLLKDVHRQFHKIYGFRNNTKEQLSKFLGGKYAFS